MNQNVLTTFSIVAINQHLDGQKFYLTNKSFIRDQVFLNSKLSDKDYENCLFYVEIDENSREYKSAIDFGQKIYFRHKISNKYLSHSQDFEEEENDTTYQLKLSHQKHFFKILPCFQYQTKISSKIRFNEEIQLVTDISGAKTGHISSRKTPNDSIKKTIIGLNSFGANVKFSFQIYYQFEKDQSIYTYGSIFWLLHVQSQSFMSAITFKDKNELGFQPIDQQKDLQSINGLWLIQSDNMGVGGRLSFEERFKLKNLSDETYASFTKGYKMIENERIYGMLLESIPSKQSQFTFKSLKDEQSLIKKGSYLIFNNQDSKYFIGARKNNPYEDTQFLRPVSYREFTDEDLFKLIELNENEEEAIRFILSIGHELIYVDETLNMQGNEQGVREGKQIFENIYLELKKLKKFDKLFQKVQGEMKRYILTFSYLLKKYRGKLGRKNENSEVVIDIVRMIYSILVIICSENRLNQIQSFKYLEFYVEDIFLNVGAQSVLIQTFRDNQDILCKVPQPIPNINENLVRVCLNIIKKYSKNKNESYWRNILKFLDLLKTLIINGSSLIDINQRLISEEFFSRGDFEVVFFGLKIINNRIKIQNQPLHFTELERIRNQQLICVIEEIFKIFSLLCSQRNFISKKYIHSLINPNNQNTIEVLIAYLSMPISHRLIDNIYSLITNLYIDSSPRIERMKPLGIVNFVLENSPEKDKGSMREDTQIADRLNSMLEFKAEEAYQTKPLQFSNILSFTVKMSMQPTLSHQQLALYKQELLEKINTKNISQQLLKSLKILIALESLSGKQILQTNSLLSKKLREGNLSQDIIIGIMEIFLEVITYNKEIQLKKLGAYLKFKYLKNDLTINYEKQSQFLLPFNKRIQPSKSFSDTLNNAILKYNNQTDMMNILSPNQEVKETLFELLIKNYKEDEQNKNQQNVANLFFSQKNLLNFSIDQVNKDEYTEKIYDCFVKFNFRQKEFLTLVMNSIVLTSEEVPVFDNLFDYYKKLKHLVAISEYWLIGDGGSRQNFNLFMKYLTEITYYLHKDYHQSQNEEESFKTLNKYTGVLVKEDQIYVNRQLFLRNVGFHELILELIKPNHYLLAMNTCSNKQKTQQNIISQQVFSLCFEFLYGFIYNCQQTKQLLHHDNTILLNYQERAQVGQTRVLRELYRGKIEYIGEINKNSIEQIVYRRILKNPKAKTNEGNEFDPLYLNFMEAIIRFNEKIYRPNLQKFYRVIEKDIYFRKIVFAKEAANNKLELCINMFDIKVNDIIQVPFIYHVKILGFLVDMFKQLESQSAIIASKIRGMFDLDYLLRILCQIDIYTHVGVEAQMRFLLKQQIMRIVCIYLEKNDTINVLHNSQSLLKLVLFYRKVFLERSPKDSCDFPNETLYIPYLKEYNKILRFYENNERHYFLEEIKPFLQKLYQIFVKGKKHINNKICDQIMFILDNYRIEDMVENYQFRQIDKKTDKIALKWLNYVDNDENNGPQQKFAKLAVVDLLRNEAISKIIQEQKTNFYQKVIAKQRKQFMAVLVDLLSNLMEKKSLDQESEEDFNKIHQYTEQLNDFLLSIEDKKEKEIIVNKLLQDQLFMMLISYVTKVQFDFKKNIAKKVYHRILKILIFIMQTSPEQKATKQFYKIFNEQNTMPLYRFWEYLNETIFTIKLSVEKGTVEEEINQSLKHLYLIVEERKENVFDEGLQFIITLCKYPPFTNFLRHQPYPYSVDFLQIMYHSLNYSICKQGQKVIINTTICDASEKLAKAISSMMLDGNQVNQNYLIDNKFPEIITEVLKFEKIRREEDSLFELERERLLNYVIEFYNKNGIDISDSIKKRIAIKDFSHSYILNRLKYHLLNTLLECVAANELSLNKIRFQIPIELLKINLIWVYEDYLTGKHELKENIILRQLKSWQTLIEEQNLDELFLMNGFYIYYLILNSEESEDNKNDEDDMGIDDKQKNKQKIVKKFFGAISDKDKQIEKQKKLQNQPFAEEMKLFYDKYYEALGFFQQKTLTVEVNFNEKLTRVYFPKIPLCEKLTPRMVENFKQNAVRISQEEKIKSLIQYEEEMYDFLQGEEDFFKKFQSVSLVEAFLRKLDEDFLRLFALIFCFIQTILFLVDDFLIPTFVFTDKIFNPANSSIVQIFIVIIGGINLLIGFLLAFYLVTKKMPILIQVVSIRESKRDEGEREQFMNGRFFYMIDQIAPEFMFTFIYIGCLVCSFIHPLFAGFILFDIMSYLQIGRQIVRSIRQTWLQLLGTILLLIIINYCYAVYVYIQFTPFFSPVCQYLFQCLLLLLDQSLKSDSGFLGSVPVQYGKNVFDLKFFSEMLYIIFAQKVIFEIFSGTIIDKFSQLRQNNNDIEEDESSMCFICGQQRFLIDFELQGFEEHIQKNHNIQNYIFYLFYLRRKDPSRYGIVEKYVTECQEKSIKTWIPNETSISKVERDKLKKNEEEEDEKQKMKEYIDKKVRQMKQIRFKSDQIMSELKLNISKIPA